MKCLPGIVCRNICHYTTASVILIVLTELFLFLGFVRLSGQLYNIGLLHSITVFLHLFQSSKLQNSGKSSFFYMLYT